MFLFELICMLLEGYLKIFTLSGFFGVFKIIIIFGFLAHTQPAQANCQRRLSRRRQIVSAGSALRRPFFSAGSVYKANCQRRLSVCVNLFPVFFQRTLSLRRQFFSAGSTCVGNFLVQAQPAQAFFQRRLSKRKKNKMANICRSIRKKKKIIHSSSHIPIQDLLV